MAPKAIFMEPSEDERIRKAIIDRVEAAKNNAGQPRKAQDAHSLRSNAISTDLFSGTSEKRSDRIVTYAVGRPYPPCTAPLADLQPIKLSELKTETHHRGKVLEVKRIGPVVQQKATSWTVVSEDGSEDGEQVQMFLHRSLYDGEELMESGSALKIKEPYFTLNDQNEPTIRIDHPSDLVVTDTGDKSAKSAKACKEAGNTALKRTELAEAHENYSKGLSLIKEGEEDLARDIHRNRALVNLQLHRYDEAKTDALASIINDDNDPKHKDLNSKAHSRAGTAAYNSGDYTEAKRLFASKLNLSPGDKEANTYVRAIEARLKEQDIGSYDFKKIRANLSQTRSRIDVASYTGKTAVKATANAGRGLFATQDIKANDLIICEKAFCVVWAHEPTKAWTAMTYDLRDNQMRATPAGLHRAVVQKLLNNPSQVEKVLDLFGDYTGFGKKLHTQDGSSIMDTFQIHDIIARNAFGPGGQFGEEDATKASAGLWVYAAYINHSCLPNAEKEYIGDLMLVRATRDIKAGEEIYHAYDESADYDARQQSLMRTWGFKCECALCAVEKEEKLEMRAKRRELEKDAYDFVMRETPQNAKRLVVVKMKKLKKRLEETYDEKKYKDLPRRAMVNVDLWLQAAPDW